MLKRLLAPVFLAALTATTPATAQDAPPLDTVMATVGETEITLGHMLALRTTLPAQYNQVPPAVLFKGVLSQLVQQELLSQDQKGELSLVGQLRLENEERAIAAAEVIASVTDAAITDAALQAAYDSKYAAADDKTEYRASHILVETEEKARELVNKLADGANFAKLAQENSTGPSGPSGGDLGWFAEGAMVPEFFEAVAALEVGTVSEPVKSQFGWHVIKLNETRTKARPSLDEVRDELSNSLRGQALDAYVAKLEAESDVDRSGSEGMNTALINRLDLLEN